LAQIEYVNGHRTFVDLLVEYVEDSEDLKKIKRLFRQFCKWFLRERALRFIIRGNMKDKIKYIHFKDNVMLKYFNTPQMWSGNKNKGKVRRNKNKDKK